MTRVYQYGLLEPTHNRDLVLDQMWKAHRYQNDLVTIEKGRRDAYRSHPESKDTINENAKIWQKWARAHCGVYWGTYLLIEGAIDLARKTKDGPAHQRYEGEGSVAVQVQTQKRLPGLVVLTPAEPPPGVRPGSRRARRQYYTLSLRVGSDDKRRPVWAQWPMVMHRPLPPGPITGVQVTRRRVGPRYVWTAQITVTCEPSRAIPETMGAVGLDLGWRQTPEGVRIASLSDGSRMLVDPRLRAQLQKVEDLRSIRDLNFNAARDALPKEGPDWYREIRRYAHAWRSPKRMVMLRRRWARERWAGDDEAFAALDAFCYHDQHLWAWESSQRGKAIRHRREIYRVFAAQLARKYQTLHMEKLNLRALKSASPGVYQLVAPGSLVAALVNAFGPERVVYVNPAYTSTDCHLCAHRNKIEPETVAYACAGCGADLDRDINAAINIRERAGETKVKQVKKKWTAREAPANV